MLVIITVFVIKMVNALVLLDGKEMIVVYQHAVLVFTDRVRQEAPADVFLVGGAMFAMSLIVLALLSVVMLKDIAVMKNVMLSQ